MFEHFGPDFNEHDNGDLKASPKSLRFPRRYE
jgi:hypothetical protein